MIDRTKVDEVDRLMARLDRYKFITIKMVDDVKKLSEAWGRLKEELDAIDYRQFVDHNRAFGP